jgi:protein involved in polysaccharide export with SLBB domain
MTPVALFAALAVGVGGAPATAASAEPRSTSSALVEGTAMPEPAAAVPPILGRIDPDTYRVGPGDAFSFRVSDLLDARVVRVNPEGAIFLPDIGAIPVAGLTLRGAEAKVRELLKPYVRGRGLVFTLYAPRRFRVAVLGEVEDPGPVTLQAPARVSEAVAAAGGVALAGARRGIEIRRGADTLWADLVRYERAGDEDANPLVFETDVLFVPAAGRWVWVLGAVPHPGRYDLARGDRLSTLISLGGGALPEASLEDATLERFVDSVRTEKRAVALGAALGAPGSAEDLPIEDGDRLFLPARSNWKRGAAVYVEGQVARPGAYPIQEGVDRVRSVIQRAGGLTELAEPTAARIERALPAAARDSSFLHLAQTQADFLLERDREWERARASARTIVSADLGALLTRGDSRYDVALLDGDVIVIPRREPFVSVQGEVRRPGAVAYQPGWRAPDYIRAAGGATGRARESHAVVTLASSGQRVGGGEAGELHPGDAVWIPARPPRSAWGTIKDVLTTAAQVATVYLVIQQATK